jgi:hypothetical protein
MKDKIKAIKEYLKYFPCDGNAKNNLLMYEYADELGIELNGGHYPRFEYGFLVINRQIKVGKSYRLTNSTTNYKQNGIDTIVIWSESRGRYAFVNEQYYRDIGSEWEEFKSILKSYNPIDYDEINNDYIFDLENGKKLIKEYDEILKVFDEKINHKINEVKTAKKRELLEKLKRELGE